MNTQLHEEIERLGHEGLNQQQIADKLGKDVSTINYHIKRYGIVYHRKIQKTACFCLDHFEAMTPLEMAKACGVSRSRIYAIKDKLKLSTTRSYYGQQKTVPDQKEATKAQEGPGDPRVCTEGQNDVLSTKGGE